MNPLREMIDLDLIAKLLRDFYGQDDPLDDSFYDRVYSAPPESERIPEQEDDDWTPHCLSEQMFDPPYKGAIAIAGVPVCSGIFIPRSQTKYRNFLDWWNRVGRFNPADSQGWDTISGPYVMWKRAEAISREDWNALSRLERALIVVWAHNLPIGMFYD